MRILETTIRDGSYVIDFKFSVQTTVEIVLALEKFGFELIEIGHGAGMNASRCGRGISIASDEDYMKAVSLVLKKSMWGMFFIPGVGRFEDIDMAVDYGMNFIRIGVDINKSHESHKYIEYAKKKGLFVSSNLMKSYIVSPEEFAMRAHMSYKAGADIVYLVDSAGSMLPEDIERYFLTTKEITNVKLGFHGHNNMCLAIANTLKAIDCGAEIVDTTLQGIGRGGGNAPTEVLIAILLKKRLIKTFDLYNLLDFSENIIKPLLKEKGINAATLISGYSMFNFNYFPIIKKYADIYNINPLELIVELCKINIINAPKQLVEKLALSIKDKNKS